MFNGAGFVFISVLFRATGYSQRDLRDWFTILDSLKGMPRFNSLRLASTGFTSRVDNCRWLNSGTVLPLIERMFHLELFRFPFPSFLEDVSCYELVTIQPHILRVELSQYSSRGDFTHFESRFGNARLAGTEWIVMSWMTSHPMCFHEDWHLLLGR